MHLKLAATQSILYIDGEIYKDSSHINCIKQYLEKHNLEMEDSNEIYELINLDDYDIAFAYMMNYGIYIYDDSLINVDINTVAEALKNEYRYCNVYSETTSETLATNTKLKKKAWLYEFDNDRICAITYIEGEVYKGYTHYDCVQEYLLNNDLEYEDELKIAFAYLHKNGDIYLMTDSMWNLSNNDIPLIAETIKEKYPNSTIYSDEEDLKIAKISKLKKLNRRDLSERNEDDGAITYIDGEIIENYTHAECINTYLKQKLDTFIYDKFSRPIMFEEDFREEELTDLGWQDSSDIQIIKDNIKQMAFAHKNSEDMSIYIEEFSLYNIDINTVAKAMKEKYPDYNIYIDETDQKIAKISRLKKLNRSDLDNRDLHNGAITYIDGEVLEGYTHAECINIYLENKLNIMLNDKRYRPSIFDEDGEIDENELSDEDFNDIQTIKDNIKQMAFAHKNSDDMIIYIEEFSLYNIDINTVANTLKNEYEEYDIYIDETEKKVAKNTRLKKLSADGECTTSPNGILFPNDWQWVDNSNPMKIQYNTTINKEYTFEKDLDNPEWLMRQD